MICNGKGGAIERFFISPYSLRSCRYSESTEGDRHANAFDTECLEGLDSGFVLKLTHAQLAPICFWLADDALAHRWLDAFKKNAIA